MTSADAYWQHAKRASLWAWLALGALSGLGFLVGLLAFFPVSSQQPAVAWLAWAYTAPWLLLKPELAPWLAEQHLLAIFAQGVLYSAGAWAAKQALGLCERQMAECQRIKNRVAVAPKKRQPSLLETLNKEAAKLKKNTLQALVPEARYVFVMVAIPLGINKQPNMPLWEFEALGGREEFSPPEPLLVSFMRLQDAQRYLARCVAKPVVVSHPQGGYRRVRPKAAIHEGVVPKEDMAIQAIWRVCQGMLSIAQEQQLLASAPFKQAQQVASKKSKPLALVPLGTYLLQHGQEENLYEITL